MDPIAFLSLLSPLCGTGLEQVSMTTAPGDYLPVSIATGYSTGDAYINHQGIGDPAHFQPTGELIHCSLALKLCGLIEVHEDAYLSFNMTIISPMDHQLDRFHR